MNNKRSQFITIRSNALDIEPGVFTWKNPVKIAKSLKHSADISTRKKASSYKSAMSMLCFYINRAGSNLSARHKVTLNNAKLELKKLYMK